MFAQALDERRLSIMVTRSGVVRKVGGSPKALFGFDPEVLVGKSVGGILDIMRPHDGGCLQEDSQPGLSSFIIMMYFINLH